VTHLTDDETAWHDMKAGKPKRGQMVVLYWPPNLEDSSSVAIVEWGGYCEPWLHPQLATKWIPTP
jgi:hypothetical protein